METVTKVSVREFLAGLKAARKTVAGWSEERRPAHAPQKQRSLFEIHTRVTEMTGVWHVGLYLITAQGEVLLLSREGQADSEGVFEADTLVAALDVLSEACRELSMNVMI